MLLRLPSVVSAVNTSSSANVSRKIRLATSIIQQKAKKSANNHFYYLPNAISPAIATYVHTRVKTMLLVVIDQSIQLNIDSMDLPEILRISSRPLVLIHSLAQTVLMHH